MMPKLIDKPAKEKRIGLALDKALNERLVTLARIEGKPPAAFAREILRNYLDERAKFIEEAKQAEAAYQQSLEQIRDQYQS